MKHFKHPFVFVLAVCLFTACSNNNDDMIDNDSLPEVTTKGHVVEFEEHPTSLTGRWYMVVAVDSTQTQEIPQGDCIVTFLDNNYAVVKNKNISAFLGEGNYPYSVSQKKGLGFDVGGIVGFLYYSLEYTEDGMLHLSNDFGKSFYFRKLKHQGDYDDINYDELKYRNTYVDTLSIASHVFYEADNSPFYLLRKNQSPWFGYHGEIEGFQHEEGYEVKAAVWFGEYGGGCVILTDARLIEILEKTHKESEDIPDYYLKQSQPGWAKK